MDREQAARAIIEDARKVRPRTSRTLWIAATAVGLVCLIGFLIVMVAEGEPAITSAQAPPQHGLGFVTGLAVGVGVGIAIGFAIARQLSRAAHSSRNSP